MRYPVSFIAEVSLGTMYGMGAILTLSHPTDWNYEVSFWADSSSASSSTTAGKLMLRVGYREILSSQLLPVTTSSNLSTSHIIGVSYNGSVARFYCDGVYEEVVQTYAYPNVATNRAGVLTNINGGSYQSSSPYECVLLWGSTHSAYFTKADFIRLAADPYQIYKNPVSSIEYYSGAGQQQVVQAKPESQIFLSALNSFDSNQIYLNRNNFYGFLASPVSGGSTFNESLTLSSGSSFSQAIANILMNSSLSLSNAVAMSQTTTALLNSSLSLSNSATMAQTVVGVLGNSLALSAGTSTAQSGGMIYVGALTLSAGTDATASKTLIISPILTLSAGTSMGDTGAPVFNPTLSLSNATAIAQTVQGILNASHTFSNAIGLSTAGAIEGRAIDEYITLSVSADISLIVATIARNSITFSSVTVLDNSVGALIARSLTLSNATTMAQSRQSVLNLSQTFSASSALSDSVVALMSPALILTNAVNLNQTARAIFNLTQLFPSSTDTTFVGSNTTARTLAFSNAVVLGQSMDKLIPKSLTLSSSAVLSHTARATMLGALELNALAQFAQSSQANLVTLLAITAIVQMLPVSDIIKKYIIYSLVTQCKYLSASVRTRKLISLTADLEKRYNISLSTKEVLDILSEAEEALLVGISTREDK